MIKAELQGRRLILTVETADDETPIAPFVVEPLSARIGRELGSRYLMVLEDLPVVEDIGTDMIRALGQENYDRLDDELRQEEGELIMQAAYFWQMITGIEGARLVLEGRETGLPKAVALFRERMAPLLSQIRRRLESELQTLQGDTPATDSPQAGAKPGRKPQDRQQPKRSTKPRASAPVADPPPEATSSD